MEQNNIGKTISKLRKEKELTQEELGNIVGVSSKTISKWECGNSIPDITILKKISNEFEISIEELLDGKTNIKNKKSIKKKSKQIIIITILLLLTISILIFTINKYTTDKKEYKEELCTIIKTYDIINISNSNDENYLYTTIKEFQTEGTYSLKLPKSISKDLKKGNSYIFTFKTKKENISVTTDILFSNSEIINIEYTDKIGMERESRFYCGTEKK